MPTLTTTIEDFAPIILYSGSGGSDWTAGSSQNDTSIDKYSDSSYMVTQVKNASVSFTFFGSALQLYGAERASHGLYQITIDSHVYPPANGSVNGGQEVFQAALFQTAALSSGLHKLTVVNLGATEFDLDFITWEIPIGKDQERLLSFTFQDSDSSFQYTPASSWSTYPPSIGTFNGGSGHVTSVPGAYVEFTFTVRPVVEIFGPVGPQGAPYSVQLDNGVATNYSSSNPFYHPQTMLFQAANLSSGAHTIRLTSEAWNDSALTLGIDYAQVFSAPSLQPKSVLATGSILAITFGILLVFSLIATGYLFFSHRRSRSPKQSKSVTPFQDVGYNPLEPTPQGLLQPTPMQSSNFRSQAINPEVISVNSQSTSFPLDRKYRPDLEALRLSSQVVETASINNSLEPTQQISMQSSNFGPQAINPETNSQSISLPQDRKYRPDLEPTRLSSRVVEAAGTSSPRSLSYSSSIGDATEEGRGQQGIRRVEKGVVVLSPETSPPIYVRQ